MSTEEKECPRCGDLFLPQPTGFKALPFSKFCEPCCTRNLFDAFELPTPPEMLDYFTKNPALTEREYQKKLRETLNKKS